MRSASPARNSRSRSPRSRATSATRSLPRRSDSACWLRVSPRESLRRDLAGGLFVAESGGPSTLAMRRTVTPEGTPEATRAGVRAVVRAALPDPPHAARRHVRAAARTAPGWRRHRRVRLDRPGLKRLVGRAARRTTCTSRPTGTAAGRGSGRRRRRVRPRTPRPERPGRRRRAGVSGSRPAASPPPRGCAAAPATSRPSRAGRDARPVTAGPGAASATRAAAASR